jgi:hypothetical protein
MIMFRIHLRTQILTSLSIAVAIALLLAITAATPPPAQGVKISPIGHPVWKPVDFHLFSAPIGTAQSGYAEFLDTALAILPAPNHAFHPELGIGPGIPHPPPYNTEVAEGVAAEGFHEGIRFNPDEFSNGMGVWLVWMNVPAPGEKGSSPDFASGPIIPNSIFPIHVEADTFHNGRLFNDFLASFDAPALDQNLNPPFDVDGHSHFPIFIADNADFGPEGTKLNGSYLYRITMLDASGNGWKIEARFVVIPGNVELLTSNE